MKQVTENPAKNRKHSFSLTVICALLITVSLTANIMAVKTVRIGSVSLFDAGTVLFPFAYMLGDALTELWGFRVARRVIFLSFFCSLILVGFTALGSLLPAPDYQAQINDAYRTVFSYVPRIVAASLVAFVCGELVNAWTLEKIKKRTGEKLLWVRTIGSSVPGDAVDTVVFVLIAFLGTCPFRDLLTMILIQYGLKLGIEIIAGTPLVYFLVHQIKSHRISHD